jgi:hypothetical protein
MNQPAFNQTGEPSSLLAWARISPPHGYRITGDRTDLHAGFTILNSAAHQRRWALQLWACPARPTTLQDLIGHVVTEVGLPPMSEIADAIHAIDLTAIARPPAKDGEFFMVLVLAAQRPWGFDEVHDFVVYPRPERFIQPRMRGEIGYRIDRDRVRLWVERIENPRDAANRSGTLALELWALRAPYDGGSFAGFHLAGVVTGSLAGQGNWPAADFDLAFSPPPPGRWHLALMLREWTEIGYLTRDYTDFSVPLNFEAPGAATPRGATPPDPVEPRRVTPVESTVRSAAEPSASSRNRTVQPAVGADLKQGEPARPPTTDVPVISINAAAERDLVTLGGLSPALARAVCRKRPFASLDELRRVKGISGGMLAKLRSRLKL